MALVFNAIVRWTAHDLSVYFDGYTEEFRNRPHVPKVGDIRRHWRRWEFANGRGVAVSYDAGNPMPGRCPLLGVIPFEEHEVECDEYWVTQKWVPVSVAFAREKELILAEGSDPSINDGSWIPGTNQRFRYTDAQALAEVLEEIEKKEARKEV